MELLFSDVKICWQYTGGSYMKNKRFLSMVLAIVLTVSLFVGIGASASADSSVINYTVQSGDYIFKICVKNGLSYYACKDAIKLLNGFTSDTQMNRIYPGQTIKLPASDAVAATVRNEVVVGSSTSSSTTTTTTTTATTGDAISYYLVQYTVKSGDSLYSICNSLGTSYNQYSNMILTLNNLTSAAHIYAGKTLYIPVSSKPSSGTYYTVVKHTVTAGETMTSICNSYGVNYSSMAKVVQGLNDGYNMNAIKVGQQVLVPTTKDVTPVTTATATVNPTSGTYTVNFATAVHGSPYATIGTAKVASANEGNTVTINANPDSGYKLKSVSVVKHTSGAAVTVTNNSFVMPADSVDITVTYETGDYAISCNAPSNGSYSILVNGIESDCANNGDKITLDIAPEYGYTVSSVTYSRPSGLNSTKVEKNSDGIYTFMMPDHAIKITVKFEKASQITLELRDVDGSKQIGTLSLEYDGTAVSGTKIPENTTVTVKINSANGYGPDENTAVTFKPDTGFEGVKFETTKISNDTWTIKVNDIGGVANPTIIVYAKFVLNQKYTLSATANDSCSAKFRVTDMPDTITESNLKEAYYEAKETNSAKAGQIVFIIPQAAYKYDFVKNDKNSNIGVTCGNGKSKVDVNYSTSCKAYYFEMPASNAVAKLKFTYTDVAGYTIIHSMKGYTESSEFRTYNASGVEKNTFAVGETIIIDANGLVPAGYKIDRVDAGVSTYNDWAKDLQPDANGLFTLTQPDGQLWVIVYITLDNNSDSYVDIEGRAVGIDGKEVSANIGSVILKNGDSVLGTNAVVGATIDINASAASGYEIYKVTYKQGESGTEKEIERNSSAKYTYTVTKTDLNAFKADPSKELIFTAYFKKANAKQYMISNSQPELGSYLIATNGMTYTNAVASGAADNAMAYAYADELITLFIKVNDSDNYTVSSVEVNGETVAFAKTSEMVHPDAYDKEYTYYATFTMTEANTVTKVNYVVVPAAAHSIVNSTNLDCGTLKIQSFAYKKDRVEFTFAACEGYEFEEILITDAVGNVITYTSTGNNSGYFDMPDCDVNIKVNFIEETPNAIDTTYFGNDNCEITTSSDTAFEGEVISVDVTPTAGYTIEDIELYYEGGALLLEDCILSKTDTHVEFKMPNDNVYIKVTTEKIKYNVTVNYDKNQASVTVVSGVDADGTTTVGTEIKLHVEPKAGYKLAKVEFNGTEVDLSKTGTEYPCSNATAADQIVTVTLEPIEYKLSVQYKTDGGKAHFEVNGKEVDKAKYGQEVKLVIEPDDGYKVTVLSEYVEKWVDKSESISENAYKFKMPAGDTTEELTFVEKT